MRIGFLIFEEITLSDTGKYKIVLYSQIERDQAPHIHLSRGKSRLASVSIYDSQALAGEIPRDIRKALELWIDSNRSMLLENWERMKSGQRPSQIAWDM